MRWGAVAATTAKPVGANVGDSQAFGQLLQQQVVGAKPMAFGDARHVPRMQAGDARPCAPVAPSLAVA